MRDLYILLMPRHISNQYAISKYASQTMYTNGTSFMSAVTVLCKEAFVSPPS